MKKVAAPSSRRASSRGPADEPRVMTKKASASKSTAAKNATPKKIAAKTVPATSVPAKRAAAKKAAATSVRVKKADVTRVKTRASDEASKRTAKRAAKSATKTTAKRAAKSATQRAKAGETARKSASKGVAKKTLAKRGIAKTTKAKGPKAAAIVSASEAEIQKRDASSATSGAPAEGWHGWDAYAAFYDWENARTVGRRDITFWRDVALRTGGRTLELGCGTGRILTPLARHGIDIVGIDRSAPMLARAEQRVRLLRRQAANGGASSAGARASALPAVSASLLRGDIRQLPFEPGSFSLVMAPYGILQSLVRERDLLETLRAVFDALAPGGRFGLDLVPDVPRWQEYKRRLSMRGRRGPRGAPVTLVESVRQDREKGLTIFDQEFIEGHGAHRQVHRFSLTFRTVSIQSLRHRLERAGFTVDAILGGYDGRPWDPRADTWVLMASKPE